MPHDPQAYFRQIQRAREVGLRMTADMLDDFRELLEDYAERLAREVALGTRTAADVRRALDVADGIMQELAEEIAGVTRDSIELTARRVAEIHARATAQLLIAEGIAGLAFDASYISTSTAQALIARPELSAAFRTIRRQSVRTVDQLLRQAAIQGVSGPQLAMQLRTHVVGADAIPERLLLDRRRIGYAALREMGLEPTAENLKRIRRAAGQVSMRAELIARTEPMNAQHEARVRSAIESPVVRAIRWRLSYAHPRRDICNTLSERNLYGLGAGRYDPRRVPPRPHPRCFCITEDELAAVEDWGALRGRVPDQVVSIQTLQRQEKLTPSETRQIAAVLRTANTRERRGRRAA